MRTTCATAASSRRSTSSRAELRFLLRPRRRAQDRPSTPAPRTRSLDGKEIALIFEKTSTRTRCAFEVAAHDQGAHVTYLDPTGSQLGHKESIADTAQVLGRMYDAIEFRGNAPGRRRGARRATPGVPVYNGLTNEWHPTQMLADFLTMHERSRQALRRSSPTRSSGDCRFNMGRSLLVMGALMGADVRLAGPPTLHPPADVDRARPSDIAAAHRARDHRSPTTSPRPSPGVDFVHTDVWVSMGEAEGRLGRAGRAARARTRSTPTCSRQPATRRSSSCTACRRSTTRDTVVGAEIMETTGMHDGLEVTDEVFELAGQHRVRPGREPPPHDQGRPRRHARELTPLAVVALGGNALLRRGEPAAAPPTSCAPRETPPTCSRRSRSSTRLVITHGNGPQVGLLALKEDAYARRLALSARRPRRRDRRPDRLRDRARARQRDRSPGHGRGDHPGARRRRRPGVRRADQVHRPGLRRGPGTRAGRRARLDRQARRRAGGAAWSPRRSRARSSSSARSAGSSTPAFSSSASAAAACRWSRPRRGHEGVEAVIDKDLASALLASRPRRRRAGPRHRRRRRLPRLRHPRPAGDRARPPQPELRAAATFAARIDGAEGRGRLPLRRGDRKPRGDRPPRGPRRARSTGPPERRSRPASRADEVEVVRGRRGR